MSGIGYLQAKRLKERLNRKLAKQNTGLKGIVIRDIFPAVKQLASEDTDTDEVRSP